MLIWFTNSYGRQVAIDNRHVISVYEANGNTIVETSHGSIMLGEAILDVVSRLNTTN
jgi:hypothetical protein